MTTGKVLENLSAALGDRSYRGVRVIVIAAPCDKHLADQMIEVFRQHEVKCWTVADIQPGEMAEVVIDRAFFEADFLLILESNGAQSTEGPYPKLVKTAVSAQLEKMPGAIKTIPMCVDGCRPSYLLREFQPLNALDPEEMQRLTKSWKLEFKRRKEHGVQPISGRDLRSMWK